MKLKSSKISLIILNYHNYKDTIECVESVLKISYPNYKIIIVDNASTNESYSELQRFTSDKCVVLRTDKNLGYAGGNNFGIEYAINDGSEYVCILNNDTIVDENFLEPLEFFLKSNINYAAVGPVILEYADTETVQSTGGNINLKLGDVSVKNYKLKLSDINNFYECDYIGGACMLISREMIKKIGNIPESYFLFFEETEWCLNAQKKGFKIGCLKASKIYHKGSVSINQTSGLSWYLMERNRARFVCRNGDALSIIIFIFYYILKTIIKTLLVNPKYISNLKYLYHGLFNKIDKKYPFVIVK